MKPLPPLREIPPERKLVYSIGMGMSLVGLLLFLSTFVTFAMNFGNFDDFVGRSRSEMLRAFGGMALLIFGGVVMTVGARGLAGSGMILDPQKARQDLEPFARASGGLTDAAFSEMPTVRETIASIGRGGEPIEVVRIRCRSCQHLNDEADRFCGGCGKPL